VETKEERKIHKMRNIQILSEFITENKTFSVIHTYLELLQLLIKNIPD